jgi:hypothetical protein
MGKHSIVIPKMHHDIPAERHHQREPTVPEPVEIQGAIQPRQTRNELERRSFRDRISLQPRRVDGLRRHDLLTLGASRQRQRRAA